MNPLLHASIGPSSGMLMPMIGIPPQVMPSQQPQASTAPREALEDAKRRFEVECEFVQSLANPNYVCFLAQRGYFKDEHFINYLKYLQYFKRQEYARTLKYPYCLQILELLQNPEYRLDMSISSNAHYVEDQMSLVWCQELRDRLRMNQELAEENAAANDSESK